MIIRATLTAAAFVSFAGLALAAPASADTTCSDGSHGPCYQDQGPFWLDTPANYAIFVPKTVNNWAHLPGDTVAGYQQAIVDTIRNYTGIDISGSSAAAANTGGPAAASLTGGPAASTGTNNGGPAASTGTNNGESGQSPAGAN